MSTPENTEKRIVLYDLKSRDGNTRTSDAELQNRIGHITKMLLEGQPYSGIVSECYKLWGVCSRTTARYIKSAEEKIKDTIKNDIKSIALTNVNYLRYTAKLAEALGQPSVCVAAIKEINSMLGIGPDTVVASNKFGDSITFTLHKKPPQEVESATPHYSAPEDNSDIPLEVLPL